MRRGPRRVRTKAPLGDAPQLLRSGGQTAMNDVAIESPAIGLRRVRASRVLSILGFVGLYASVLIALGMMNWMRTPSFALLVSTYFYWLGPWIASYVVWFLEPTKRGRIVIGADLRIERGGSTRVLAPADVESAQAVQRADGMRVEVVAKSGDVFSIAVASLADADAIVDRLGFGPGGRRQRVDLAAPKRRYLHLAIGFLAYQAVSIAAVPVMIVAVFVSLGFAMPLMMGAIGVLLPFVYRYFRRRAAAPRLEIGDDGVSLLLANRPPRFLARKNVYGAQVVVGSGNISLNTAEGPILVSAMSLDPAVSKAALHALERRWTATAAAPGPRVATFERAGRPLDAWRAELAAKLSPAGYRGDGTSIDEAEATLRNAGAPPDARLGAALALAAAGERVRIASAAAPIADERLRIALEAVAHGHDDPALLEAASDTQGDVRRAAR